MKIEIKYKGLEIRIWDVTVKEFVKLLSILLKGVVMESEEEKQEDLREKFKEWLLKRGYKKSTAELYTASLFSSKPYQPAKRLYEQFLSELKGIEEETEEIGMWCRFCDNVVYGNIASHYIEEHPEEVEKDVVELIEKNWKDDWFTLKAFAVCYDLDEKDCRVILDWLVDKGVLKKDGDRYKLRRGLDILFEDKKDEDFDLKKHMFESRKVLEGTLK